MNTPASHKLTVTKTARYSTLGDFSDITKEVWIVLHGYAQLASDFILPFTFLDDGSRFIVAPEGLNRFYAKGFGGKPAATWMTSEMRESEIQDYVLYLNTLYENLRLGEGDKKVVLLGFSQGVATATRWLHNTSHRVDELIIYAGDVAAEHKNPVSPKLSAIPVTYITGDNDRLIEHAKLAEVKLFMKSIGAREVVFSGGHEVKESVLRDLLRPL
ncbi:MAG: phospholipase [Bacteroidota bacterium]